MKRSLFTNFIFTLIAYLAVNSPARASIETITGTEYEMKASSVLRESGRDYAPANLASMNIQKAWCEGGKGNGVGEWVELNIKQNTRTTVLQRIDIKILPGLAVSDQLYRANARPSRISIRIFERMTMQAITVNHSYTFNLADSPFMQVFSVDIGRNVDLSKVSLVVKIDDVVEGNKYQDMCITELRVFLRELGRDILELDNEMSRQLYEKETEYLKASLPNAEKGDADAIQGLMRLVNGIYYTSAEGAEWLGEIYLDLLIKYPNTFLFLLTRQEEKIINKIIEENLLRPINDKYSNEQLLEAVRNAQKKGLNPPFFKKLIEYYSKQSGTDHE